MMLSARPPKLWRRPHVSLVALISAAGLLAGCQGIPEDLARSLAPQQPESKFADVKDCTRIAVLPFQGDREGIMASRAESAIARTGQFTLVDRQRIDQVLNEIGLQSTALTDEATAVRVGRLAGADCIMSAAVSLDRVERGSYTAEQCQTDLMAVPGFLGKTLGMCKDHEIRSARCQSMDAFFTMVPRITDVESGSVVYVETINGKGQMRNCSGPAGVTEAEVQEEARADAFAQLTTQLTPAVGETVVAGGSSSAGGGCAAVPNGPAVRDTQQKLATLGYPVGTPDGLFGPATANSLSQFRQDQGLGGGGALTQCNADEITTALDAAVAAKGPPTAGPDIQLTADQTGGASTATTSSAPPPSTASGFEDLGLD